MKHQECDAVDNPSGSLPELVFLLQNCFIVPSTDFKHLENTNLTRPTWTTKASF